nr:glycosyltransferase family 4 protein [Candidatus Njordarchaeum guaymaensis]
GLDQQVLLFDIPSQTVHIRDFCDYRPIFVPLLCGTGPIVHLVRMAFFCSRLVMHLFRLIHNLHIDVVHTHSQISFGAVMLLRALARSRFRLVHTVHNPNLFAGIKTYSMAIEIAGLSRTDAVIVLTRSTRDLIVKNFRVDPHRLFVVPTGFDEEGITKFKLASHKKNRRSQQKVVLCVSRICRRKNQLTILRAIPLVLEQVRNISFVFIGPVEEKDYLNEMVAFVRDHGLDRSVQFLGEVSKERLYETYEQSSIFVLASFGEVQPQALLEAMSFGIPSVASNTGAVLDMARLADGTLGVLLVDPTSHEQIADMVIRLLTDGQLAEMLQDAGRRIASAYSWKEIRGRVLEVYQSGLTAVLSR